MPSSIKEVDMISTELLDLPQQSTSPTPETGKILVYTKQSLLSMNNELFMMNEDGVEIQLTLYGSPTYKTQQNNVPTICKAISTDLTTSDSIVIFKGTTTESSVVLPGVQAALGMSIYIKNASVNNLTLVNYEGEDLFDGELNQLTILPNHCYYLISDGTRWRTLNHFIPA